jgi:hypothetical protein
MLREIAADLWVAEQPLYYWGMNVGTRMTIMRLRSGSLVVISPIQIESPEAIRELGPVSHIIAPNLYHHCFIAEFKALFPEAQLWAVPGLRAKRPDLSIDAWLDGAGQIQEQISYFPFRGFRCLDLKGPSLLNEIVFLHIASQTLILTDTAYHFDATYSWPIQLAAQIIGVQNKLQPSRLCSNPLSRFSVGTLSAW